MCVKSESYRFGKRRKGAENSERGRGRGNQRWAGFSSYLVGERNREREEMSLELSHYKTEVCRFI